MRDYICRFGGINAETSRSEAIKAFDIEGAVKSFKERHGATFSPCIFRHYGEYCYGAYQTGGKGKPCNRVCIYPAKRADGRQFSL